MDKILKSIYFNDKHPASFTGVERVYRAARTLDSTITRKYVKNWLAQQDTYTLNKPARIKFKRSRLISSGLHVQTDIDLADVTNLAKSNHGVRFLLVSVDTFSRKLYVQPLKSKKPIDVVAGFEKLWADDPLPALVRTDKGPEFTSHITQRFFKSNDIHHFTSNNEVKAHFAERVIRSLRMRIHRLITHRQSERYIDSLQNLVSGYNNSIHSSIGIAPANVNKSNERSIWWSQYWPRNTSKKLQPYLYNTGDLVRISYLRHAFTRGYDYTFSGEVFKVIYRTRRDKLPIYTLEDLAGDRVTGTFYNEELTPSPHGDEWKIDKILRRRPKRRGHPAQVYVKWLHYPAKFNSWVNADSLVDV